MSRKPLFGLADGYIACTCDVTVQERRPVPELDVAALPVVAGWLFQVTPVSVQLALGETWKASIVLPVVAEDAFSFSVASVTEQPVGLVGRLNATSARPLRLVLRQRTVIVVAVPLLVVALVWSTQLSRLDVTD